MEKNEKMTTESFKAYEDGKHRRYNLLFAVNGGAFAIAKLITEFTNNKKIELLGNLTLDQLSLGMIAFTIVMCFDIFMFGWKIRKNYLPSAFAWQGMLVLVMIAFLICLGWLLAACPFDQLLPHSQEVIYTLKVGLWQQ